MSSAAYADTLVKDAPLTRPRIRAGRALSTLAVLFLLFDTVIKLLQLTVVIETFTRLGMPEGLAPVIGVVELVCVALYVLPRTSVVGAVLLTGFLGGATALHVRVGDPLLSHVLFPFYVGALLWGGLLLRDGRLRALVSARSAD